MKGKVQHIAGAATGKFLMFGAVPVVKGKTGEWGVDTNKAIPCETLAQASRAAIRLRTNHAAVIVYSREHDTESGETTEPAIVERLGAVPSDFDLTAA